MPRYPILRKSGVHRAACFALYRALLRQKHELQLNERQQHLFRKPIRAVFKRNAKLQSPSQISTALQLGYETLEGLYDGTRQQGILDRIFELTTQTKPNSRLGDLPLSPREKNVPAHKARKKQAGPYPGAARTLDRPFQNLSGRRHVPVLINANRVPFLRITKPQPPSLSRIIRNTTKRREHRLASGVKLAAELPIAENEDQWDQILHDHTGLDQRSPSEQRWQHEVKQAFVENHKLQVEAIQKRADMSAKMFAIVEEEKALAEEEKLRIRDEKHKARKSRRLARRASTESEVEEGPYSQTEETVRHDPPTTTKEVPNPDQEEVRSPYGGKEWRKRSDKYRTSDELKRLYETSLRPKTDEEIAKVKEARARRKEKESELKAQKLKRRQEGSAHWKRKVNEEAKVSTKQRLDTDKPEVSKEVEQSLRSKTNEEVAEIKKARTRRKKENSERKAQRLMWNEEKATCLKRRVNGEVEDSTNKRPATGKPEINKEVEQSTNQRLGTDKPETNKYIEESINQRPITNNSEVTKEADQSKNQRLDTDKPEDLNKEPLFLSPSLIPGVRRTGTRPQPEVPPLPEEPRQASGLNPDAAPGRMEDETREGEGEGEADLDRLCQSLFRASLRNIQRRGHY